MKKLCLLLLNASLLIFIMGCSKSDTSTPAPKAPVAKAGDDQAAFVGELVNFDGSASTDPEGGGLTYKWSFSTKPSGSTANIINADKVKPNFSPDKVGDYVITLTVSNGKAEGSVTTKVVAGGAPFIMDFLNQATIRYSKDVGATAPGDVGYQFSVSKDIKVTHLAVFMPEAGKYKVTIWNPQSMGVIYQGEVEQKAIGSLGSAKVTPNPIELATGKKYIVSVYLSGSPFYYADKPGSANIFPFTSQLVTIEGTRITLGTNSVPTIPTVAYQELYRTRGFAAFAYVEK